MSPRGDVSLQGRTRHARPVRNRRENRKRPYLTYHLPRQQLANKGPRPALLRRRAPGGSCSPTRPANWLKPAGCRLDRGEIVQRHLAAGGPHLKAAEDSERIGPTPSSGSLNSLPAWVSSSGETLLKTEPALPTPPRRRAPGRRTTHFQAARSRPLPTGQPPLLSPHASCLPSSLRRPFIPELAPTPALDAPLLPTTQLLLPNPPLPRTGERHTTASWNIRQRQGALAPLLRIFFNSAGGDFSNPGGRSAELTEDY